MLRYSATEVFLESDLDPLSFMQHSVLPFAVVRLFSMPLLLRKRQKFMRVEF